MPKKHIMFVLVFLSVLLMLAACTGGAKTQVDNPVGVATDQRPTPPVEYADLKSPKLNNSELGKGQQLYNINCVSCHGEKGLGDGPAAASLNPKPEPLALNQSSLSDSYLFWRISEGGQMEQFKSAMPAWKTILSEEKIWQVIGYLRNFGG